MRVLSRSCGVDADEGVAVAAFVVDGQVRGRSGVAAVALGHDPRARARARRPAPPRAPGPAPAACRYGGSRKTRSYVSPRAACVAEERAGVAARRTSAARAESERLEVGPHRRAPRARVALDERGRCAAPRESASMPSAPEPAKRSSTRAPSTGPEHREQRLAHAVGRRPRVAARRARRRPPAAAARPATTRSRRGSARAPRRRSAARARPRAARARARRARDRRRRSASARARARSSSVGVLGQPRDAERAPGPDWRVPISSPSPRSSRSISASRKPSRCSASACSRARLARAEQQAQRRVLAAADAPAQLVQLGDPVALGVLDEHHGRVGHVDADLDHRRRDEHVGLARGEAPPSPPASRAGACGRAAATTPEVARARVAAQALELGRSPRAPAAPRTPRPAGRRRRPGGPARSSSRMRS